MAIIKKSEFQQMDQKQMEEKLIELKKELMKLNSQIRMGTTLESPGRPKLLKKTIAQIYTRSHEKKHAQAVAEQKQPQKQEQKPTGGKKK